ncbi:adenosylcobinamide-GDP ribazoletransferase [Mesorhizobium sp. L-8-10]|uniref:adenosylcobinamide-GDP ribazoletransferase n=1 Tax=Mesorhizobium sp. L-8-10 TaxID=2744523 RepID=UPI001927D017|nr:adenosylcobinamide-GDP ribazoletransferase [Mesorhizobium sp. L-8-10]BCH35448.1 adenosylcobinamide-GDP ribazoletransferase [Mesorhizobium sp. L-8-10]
MNQSRGLFADIILCLAFYTRLPLGGLAEEERSFADAQWAAPLAGVVVAIGGWIVFWLGFTAGAPALVTAALALTAILCITGCLHEDGAADVADGFGGGTTRERKLEIMRDSRLGTFGVATIVVTFLIRWSAIAALATPDAALAGLVAAHAASRALIPAFMALVPPARLTGLSARAGNADWPVAIGALAIGAVCLFGAFGFAPALVATIAIALWFFLLKRLSERQIGGQTGDVLGALQQGGEIITLVAASIFFT